MCEKSIGSTHFTPFESCGQERRCERGRGPPLKMLYHVEKCGCVSVWRVVPRTWPGRTILPNSFLQSPLGLPEFPRKPFPREGLFILFLRAANLEQQVWSRSSPLLARDYIAVPTFRVCAIHLILLRRLRLRPTWPTWLFDARAFGTFGHRGQ